MFDIVKADRILEYACRAPSVHNTQPWSWHVSDNRVDLVADRSRRLVITDPQGRDLALSCGAALHHFQVAAHALGWSTRIHRASDPAVPELIARIQVSETKPDPDGQAVLDAIMRRHTDRRSVMSRPVPGDRLHALAALAARWGVQALPLLDAATRSRVLTLTERAGAVQKGDPRYVDELDRWTTYWGSSGVPVANLPKEQALAASPATNRGFVHGAVDEAPVDPNGSSDAMLLLCTSSDDLLSRIRAGEALSAIWLAATVADVALVPLSQALEVEETRLALQDEVLHDTAVAQLVVRLGWLPPSRPQLARTPRRRVDEVRRDVPL
jgi:hypothetical protein